MIRHKKRLDGIIPFAKNMTDDDSADPDEPDSVFQVVSKTLLWILRGKAFKAFRHSAGRAKEPTPKTAKKHP